MDHHTLILGNMHVNNSTDLVHNTRKIKYFPANCVLIKGEVTTAVAHFFVLLTQILRPLVFVRVVEGTRLKNGIAKVVWTKCLRVKLVLSFGSLVALPCHLACWVRWRSKFICKCLSFHTNPVCRRAVVVDLHIWSRFSDLSISLQFKYLDL
jgi:hypothetical protein